MTQLVELQQALSAFEAAGIRLYAVSYDSVDALSDFAERHGIQYPLLSDAGSVQIRRLGLLNTQIPPHEIPFHGVPWPGTFLLDEDGVVIEKFFHSNPVHRVTAERVVGRALGRLLLSEEAPQDAAGDDDIRVQAIWQGNGLHRSTVRNLVVRFTLADGMHIYGDPVPEGMVPTSVEVTGPPGLRVGAPERPPTHDLHMPLLGATLPVWDGTVDMVFPVWADSRLLGPHTKDPPPVPITVHVRYQGCNGQTCLIPRAQTLHLSIPVTAVLAQRQTAARHLGRQVLRGLRQSPLRGALYLLQVLAQLIGGPRWRSRAP